MAPGEGFHSHIVYVDESGDHGPASPEYPVLVLVFCCFEKDVYASEVTTAVQKLKFEFFGHDTVVLHEREIRMSSGPFSILLRKDVKDRFLKRLNSLLEQAPFHLIAVAIDKRQIGDEFDCDHPYHIALREGLKLLTRFLSAIDHGGVTHIVCESRGDKEDKALLGAFERWSLEQEGCSPLKLLIAPKKGIFAGMEIADLVARPIGRRLLNASQPNRAYEILRTKFASDDKGAFGLCVWPEKPKGV